MKKCRHLADFLITETPAGPNTGAPPFIALCEDCAASAKLSLDDSIKRIVDAKPSGKSVRAQNWARFRRVSEDITKPVNIAHEVQLIASHEAKLQHEKYGGLT